MEELLHWPPAAWRSMGWREFVARWTHLRKRMDARRREQESADWFAQARQRRGG